MKERIATRRLFRLFFFRSSYFHQVYILLPVKFTLSKLLPENYYDHYTILYEDVIASNWDFTTHCNGHRNENSE